MVAARGRHRRKDARTSRRPPDLHAVGQPHHAGVRRADRDGHRYRACPARGCLRPHGRRLGAADRRARHRSGHGRPGAHQCRRRAVHGARGGGSFGCSCRVTLPSRELGRGGFQELAQADIARPVTKASWTATSTVTIGSDIARAMRLWPARAGRVRSTSAFPSTFWIGAFPPTACASPSAVRPRPVPGKPEPAARRGRPRPAGQGAAAADPLRADLVRSARAAPPWRLSRRGQASPSSGWKARAASTTRVSAPSPRSWPRRTCSS